MYDFDLNGTDKGELYKALADAADAITLGESDAVANMANIAALLWQAVPDVNWAGFYRLIDGELVLGPFQGRAACIRIALGKGVCGTAAARLETQLVDDVHSFPGHIACDARSRSELVVPIITKGSLKAVIDLDSPTPSRFDRTDAFGIEALASRIADRI